MKSETPPIVYQHDGQCPICERPVRFTATSTWYRDTLRCPSCRSVVRERALALVLMEMRPNWRALSIHESSPAPRGISEKLKAEGAHYVASHYFPDQPRGALHRGFRNEDLERQTFADQSFDLVVTLDVMEHVFEPARVYTEIWRTLRPGGLYIHTFPITRDQMPACQQRAERRPDGSVRHQQAPVYHGNPIDAHGSLVTFDYGYEIDKQIANWAPFDVRILRFSDATHGIIGEYTEVVVCAKQ